MAHSSALVAVARPGRWFGMLIVKVLLRQSGCGTLMSVDMGCPRFRR
jgi:hypothetical protein